MQVMPTYFDEDNSKQTENDITPSDSNVTSNNMEMDIASLKIIELSKKIRELNAALISERNRCNRLYQVVKQLESGSVSSSNKEVICNLCKQHKLTTSENVDNTSERSEQDKKLKKMESIVSELRQKVQILNHDLLLAKKVVEAETGETIPNINTWLTNMKSKTGTIEGTWRGRQQQITALKSRIAKLQTQLVLKTHSPTEDVIYKDKETFSGATLFGANYFQDNDNDVLCSSPQVYNNSPKLNHIVERNAIKTTHITQLQNDKKRLEEDLDSIKRTHQKTKLRINNLLQEQKDLKQQIVFLIQKGKHDDELVESLVQRNDDLQNELKRMNQINIEKDKKRELLSQELSNFEQTKNMEIKKLEEIINEKNQCIENLNERLDTINQSQMNQLNNQLTEQSKLNEMESLHYDEKHNLQHIQNLTIERDGLVKLVENMEYRIEELFNEKMKLEMQNAELTRKTIAKSYSIKKSLLPSEKFNQNKEQLINYLTHQDYINDIISQCSLTAHSMKIITKYIKQLQTTLIQYDDEISSLKNNLKLSLDYRKDDLKLIMQVIDELRQQKTTTTIDKQNNKTDIK
uniref:Coiled-coil domain-containing protein 13 n=1 Tax=Schistosoma japonicum TaxID=6182 RepID=C1LEU5_SCHJA|nr:Coiled-coil domain-containing protein 13 [Schistosoma japonicum]